MVNLVRLAVFTGVLIWVRFLHLEILHRVQSGYVSGYLAVDHYLLREADVSKREQARQAVDHHPDHGVRPLVELVLALLDHEAHGVAHHQTVYQDLKQLELVLDWSPQDAVHVVGAVLLDLILAEHLEDMAEDVDNQQADHDHLDLEVVLQGRALFVRFEEESDHYQADDLHFDDGFNVVNDVRVRHGVCLIDFRLSLRHEFVLALADAYVVPDPSFCVLIFNNGSLAYCHFFEHVFIVLDREFAVNREAFNHDDSARAAGVEALGLLVRPLLLVEVEVDRVRDLGNHSAQVGGFELLGLIDAYGAVSRLNHQQHHRDHVTEIHDHFDQEPDLSAASPLSFELLSRRAVDHQRKLVPLLD